MDIARPIRSFVIRRLTDPARRDAARRAAERRRVRAGRPHEVLYFHQVDDPYSRLAAQALEAFLARFDVRLRFLPVAEPASIAIHDPDMWQGWAETDATRIAPYYGMHCTPARSRPEAGALQLAQRVLCRQRPVVEQARVAVALGEALATADDGALAALAAAHGEAGPEDAAAMLRANEAQRHRLGHYLGGMFHYGGEWYWGVDRLHYLEDRLSALGARRPGAPPGYSAPLQRQTPAPSSQAAGRLRLEYFPSLRSPYSHLSYGRVAALRRRYPLEVVVRPVLPMMMRGVKADRRKTTYIVKDTKREAERLGIDFGHAWDPFGKPVLRAYSLFPWARDAGRGLEYLQAYSNAVWAQGVNAWNRRGLQRIVEAAGLDWHEAEAHLDHADWRPEIEANAADMLALGCWGVPSFHLPASHGREAFVTWGQDRLWLVEEEIARRLAGTVDADGGAAAVSAE